jgi:hypothetical protein
VAVCYLVIEFLWFWRALVSPKPRDRPKTREEWEPVLRDRLERAQAEYHSVSEECKRLTAISQDAERPDSPVALRQALGFKATQLQNYMAVLRQFTDFTVCGKFPDK